MVSLYTHHDESYLTSHLLTHILFIHLFAFIHFHSVLRFSCVDFQVLLKGSRDGKRDGRVQIEDRERVKSNGRHCKEDMRVTNNFSKVPHATQDFDYPIPAFRTALCIYGGNALNTVML